MRKLTLCVIFLVGAVGALAQGPSYTVFSTSPVLADDGDTLELNLSVFNNGGDASLPADLTLTLFGEETVVASTQVEPLASAASQNVALRFGLSSIGNPAVGERVVMQIRLESPEIETEERLIEFEIPGAAPVVQPTASPQADTTPNADQVASSPAWWVATRSQIESWLGFLPFDVDLSQRSQLAVLVGVVGGLVMLFWLLTVILRLVFSSPPRYPRQPAPYANMPQQRQDTLAGRRQMWQYVTQNGSMLADETEGNLHARKALLGTDGLAFSGWRVVGVRASQYDQYGRLARSQVIGHRGMCRRLSKAIDRAKQLERDRARRWVRPVARELARKVGRRVTRKTANLPVALDVKFRGEHGEVSILFELYQYQQGGWRELDQWTPDMVVSRHAIYESYTYTVFGRRADEGMRQYRKRLRENITFLLTEMVLSAAPPPQPTPQADVTPTTDITQMPTREGDRWMAPTTDTQHPMPPAEDTVPGDPYATGEQTDTREMETPPSPD